MIRLLSASLYLACFGLGSTRCTKADYIVVRVLLFGDQSVAISVDSYVIVIQQSLLCILALLLELNSNAYGTTTMTWANHRDGLSGYKAYSKFMQVLKGGAAGAGQGN